MSLTLISNDDLLLFSLYLNCFLSLVYLVIQYLKKDKDYHYPDPYKSLCGGYITRPTLPESSLEYSYMMPTSFSYGRQRSTTSQSNYMSPPIPDDSMNDFTETGNGGVNDYDPKITVTATDHSNNSLNSPQDISDVLDSTINSNSKDVNSVSLYKNNHEITSLKLGNDYQEEYSQNKSTELIEMENLFPGADSNELQRFLIARKNKIVAAKEMYQKYLSWRQQNFPVTFDRVKRALSCKCMFYHGSARDGTPVLYYRNAYYDKSAATPDEFVLVAAYCMDYALAISQKPNVTVVVHTAGVPGAVNGPADMNFIKAFIKFMSDNYPERLKRLILYPFPWMAQAIWNIARMFIDQRTKDKMLLLSGSEEAICKALYMYIDPDQIPIGCWGNDASALWDPAISLKSQEIDD